MQIIKRTALVALILLPAFFLLHNYNEMFGFIPGKRMVIYSVMIYCILAIAYFVVLHRGISVPKAALILFVFCFFVLFFTPIHQFFRIITFQSIFSSYWILFPIWCLLIWMLVRKVIRMVSIPAKINRLLNTVLIVLVMMEVFAFVINSMAVKKSNNLIYSYKPLYKKYISSEKADSSKPDIYFLVFDEYTNSQTLKEIWGFDNSQISNWLNGNGYYTPSHTRANYNFTLYSVSSTFNMNYIDPDKGSDGTVVKNILQANRSLSDNEVFSILKKENYIISFLAPFKNCIQENGLGNFFDQVYDNLELQTLPGSLYQNIKWNLEWGKLSGAKDNETSRSLKSKYDWICKTVDKIKNSADSTVDRRPHFIYGHLMIPHEPPIFDSAGRIMTQKESSIKPEFETYPAQVRFVNNLIKEIVTHIRLHNKANSIVIIEGDHGFRGFPADSMYKYSLPNFSAFYFPDKNYSRLYNSMSPVNIFRIVFDQYFDQNFPLLKDSGILVKDD